MTEQQNEIKKHVVKDNAISFSRKVEELVWEKDIGYLEAIQTIMDEKGYEPENMRKLLTEDLYAKLELEAEKLSLVKKRNRLDM